MTILKESWVNLTKPASVNLKEGFDDLKHSVIVFEPFERGFGNTLGNSLRRVLLSSITGFAVVGVKIEGVLHEYSTINGIKEDVLEIIMNLKCLAISKDNSEPVVLKLHSDKIGSVYNRLVIWDGKMIHSATMYGEFPRLVHLFFFNVKK